jgi:ribose transport system permease protein
MSRIAGVLTLLVALYVALYFADPGGNSFKQSNLIDVTNRQGLFGVITVGVAVLIVTGAIDLSIGSVVGFSAVAAGLMMTSGIHIRFWRIDFWFIHFDGIHTGPIHPYIAVPLVLLMGSLIGLVNGLLVTRLKLQSFLVTLCGLFVYRGLARYLTLSPVGVVGISTTNPSFRDPLNTLRAVLIGKDENSLLRFPMEIVVLLILATIIGLLLHKSVIGRYWYAMGYNESAARYSGIATDRYRLIGFVISSTLASLCGVMLLFDYGTANPTDAGEMWELYAITGAVLGGCSLRGGEGTIVGVVLGAMVLPVLRNLVSFLDIKDALIPAVVGLTLLFGTLADELFRRRSAVRK